MKFGVAGEGRAGDEELRCRSEQAREADKIFASQLHNPLLLEVQVPLVGEVAQIAHQPGFLCFDQSRRRDLGHHLIAAEVAVLEAERCPRGTLFSGGGEERDFRVAHRVAVLLRVVRYAHL